MTQQRDQDGPPEDTSDGVVVHERLQIVIASAEVAPYSKTGGLGDVAGSLPGALAERGHRVMVITPKSNTLSVRELNASLGT